MQNLRPPMLLPELPTYPDIPQIVRVTAPSIGANVYPAVVQQYNGALSFRDREACYVKEPNNVALSPAFYDCRLVGSYLGLPLFATTCCVSGSFSSSLSSSTPLGAILRTPLGTDVSPGLLDGRTIPGVQMQAGLLQMMVATVGGSPTAGLNAYAGGVPLLSGITVDLPAGAAVAGRLHTFYGIVPTGSLDVVLELAFGVTGFLMTLANVTGLLFGVEDQDASANGLASSPDAGATGATGYAAEYVGGAFLMAGSSTGTWQNSFSAGQSASGTFAGVAVTLQEGYRILSSLGAVHAALGGITPAAWCGMGETYK